ncbi:MAG: GIY-YIG nuclease family protein [Candidatus Magasanikbacteria bacterium]|nr:GIY-YIG nuclease family protein [Candidatus Magasanikbacteria bacterium]MBT6294248.1 GIY-YIG nuclease family protein [Candidatus Magasanikbacteria bacterium]
MTLEKKIQSFPDSPGIYLFFNAKKEIIYIGKATSLKKRVTSYFTGKRTGRPIERMMHEVVSITVKQTESALEAIIAEANAITQYLPKYNVLGKDNKSWNYIGITRDTYPQIHTIRQHDMYKKFGEKTNIDGYEFHKDAKQARQVYKNIFGPYPGLNTNAAMRLLQRLFYFSTCKPGAKRPCLYYQMGKCLGVCIGTITPIEYKKQVIAPLTMFLKGGKKRVITTLEKRMKGVAKERHYEHAARLRDQITALRRIHDIALINNSFTQEDIVIQDQESKPLRIEGYDISHLGGKGMVGSMVVFVGGHAKKSDYRIFSIKSVVGQNDVACLAEVLTRRLQHGSKEAQNRGGAYFWPLPDLFLIDGGKPQIHAVMKVLENYNIRIPVVGIAKGSERKKNEFIFGKRVKNVIMWVDAHRTLLIAIRDEAHRFALKYQKKKRKL